MCILLDFGRYTSSLLIPGLRSIKNVESHSSEALPLFDDSQAVLVMKGLGSEFADVLHAKFYESRTHLMSCGRDLRMLVYSVDPQSRV